MLKLVQNQKSWPPNPAMRVYMQQSTMCTLRARPPSSSRRAQITFEAIHFPPSEATQKAPPSSLRLDVVNCTKDVYNDRLHKMLQLSNMWTILEQIVLVFIFFLFHVNIICGQKQLRTITFRVQTVQVYTNQFSKCRLDSCHWAWEWVAEKCQGMMILTTGHQFLIEREVTFMT